MSRSWREWDEAKYREVRGIKSEAEKKMEIQEKGDEVSGQLGAGERDEERAQKEHKRKERLKVQLYRYYKEGAVRVRGNLLSIN